MRAKLSAVCPSIVSNTILISAVLGAAIFAGGCPKILRGSAPDAVQTTPDQSAQSTQTTESTQSPENAAENPELGAVSQAKYSSVYCSGFIKDERFSRDLAIISGEDASYKVVFSRGEYVYVSQGAAKGIKVGDRFMVIRPESDPSDVEWFKGQHRLANAMGIRYRDVGQLRIVNVQPKVSVAQVSFSCDYMQRGDVVRPFQERPAPPIKYGAFDHFAPVSGKSVGMIVNARDWEQGPVQSNVVYVNLGAAQGLKIGDYLRIFRYEGHWNEYIPVIPGYEYELYGFGSAPERYSWKDLPRMVLGEGVVLNASRNAATMLITHTESSVFTGDEVEIE